MSETSDFKPGDECIYSGASPIAGPVTVVAWTPERWAAQGCEGNYTFRRGLVPVFSAKFPATRFWWAAPHQLTRIAAPESCPACGGVGRIKVQDAKHMKDPPPPCWIDCDKCRTQVAAVVAKADCKAWPGCGCILRGNAKRDCSSV